MAELDQEFVEYVVKALVVNPDAVVVKRSVDDMGVLLELTVDPADMGKVIGKAGATAKSIRTLLRVLGAKSDARVNLKIVEPEGVNVPAEAEAQPEVDPVGTDEVSADEAAPVEAPAEEAVVEEAAPAEEAPAAEAAPEETNDLHEKTRAELAELADLDL
jgi:uncharacterized protein